MLYLNFFFYYYYFFFLIIFLLLLELFILGYIYIFIYIVCVAYPLNVRSTMEIRRSHLCDFFLVFPFV